MTGENFTATVMVGEFAGATSPATMYSPIVGADISCAGPASCPSTSTSNMPSWCSTAGWWWTGRRFRPGPLGYLGVGRSLLAIQALPDTRFVLIGGEPFQEELLMWWNFVARTHEEVEEAREAWEAQDGLADAEARGARYGLVEGHGPDAGAEAGRIPAPVLPTVRLTPRKRTHAPDRPVPGLSPARRPAAGHQTPVPGPVPARR